MIILGQITAINALDVVVALPNSLSGYAAITNISSLLSMKLQNAENSDDEDDENIAEEEVPTLNELFTVGQWVRCAVIAVAQGNQKSKSGQKQKKRIDLSLQPDIVNKGIAAEHIQNRSVLQASIKSIEDHGLVMDLGIDNCTGFIKAKEYGTFDPSSLKQGQVMLCSVTAAEGDRKVIQLSADLSKNPKRLKLKSISNVDAVLPGDGVEVVIADAHDASFSGKILGLLDATCDIFQAGMLTNDRETAFKAGEKVLGRVLFVDPEAEPRKVAVSLLPHLIDFATVSTSAVARQDPLEAMPIGFVLDQVTVKSVQPNTGLFCDIGLPNVLGFVHISRVSEGKVDALNSANGKYRVGSQHPARIVGYSAVDGMFLLSMEQGVIEAKFLNVSDVSIGEVVKGTVERFISGGLLIKLSESRTGLVPEAHIADVKLQFPEKKFKEGLTVTCRVLDLDTVRRRVILTLKKSLVNSEIPIISSFDDVQIGSKTSGVISKLFDNGALIQFYGGVHAFLPSSEMSEAYISNPKEHFRIGQTLSVHVIKLDASERKMTVSCKDSAIWDQSKTAQFEHLELGVIVSATITEKTSDKLVVSISPGDFVATLEAGHLSDGDFAKCDKLFQKARVGGHLKEVVVIDKQAAQKQLILSMKPTLLKAAKDKTLLTRFEDISVGSKLNGFVRKATDYGVLVGFAGGLTGLALKHNLSEQYVSMPASIFSVSQSINCTVIEVDAEQQRFQVSFKDEAVNSVAAPDASSKVVNAIDSSLLSTADLVPGRVVSGKIASVKDTQLNIDFADNLQGRVDVSSIYESFEEISSTKRPLKSYKVNQIVKVKITGYHDARNHKFLPLTHRQSNSKTIFECTLRPSEINSTTSSPFDFKDVEVGSLYTAFVNNFGGDCLWVNISPIVRGRINLLDLQTEAKTADEIQQQYTVGTAIQCRVLHYAASTKHLDLSERAVSSDAITQIDSVKVGALLPAKITKVTESGLLAQLSDNISGKISLTDISSNYTDHPTQGFKKNSLVQVLVKVVDVPNKKIALSLRHTSDANVDPEINSVKDLELGKQYRGYIKNVADQGLFIELGRDITARVKIGETSDAFIKEWKKGFSVDQLVSGKVIAIDAKSGKVEFSLKKNAKVAKPQTGLSDLAKGQVVEATVKKIEDFGIFIQVNSVAGVSGLCHKSEIADKPVKDINAIYSVGDLVKAKVLDINLEKRRISFGLKSSYFKSDLDDVDVEMAEDESDDEEDEAEEMEAEDEDVSEDDDDDDADSVAEDTDKESIQSQEDKDALAVDNFDWTGASVFDTKAPEVHSDSEAEDLPAKKKSKKEKKSYDDSAVDFAGKQPESTSDFERLVLGEPDSSLIWMNYMAFHMQLSDFEAARAIADRALKSINYRLESEKLNIWMALLNLENNFGTEATLESTFKRSCETNDPQEMYSRLVGTFIRSQKSHKAIETYDVMLKKFGQNPKVWIEYATFLASEDKLEESRDLLPRSLKSLPKSEHVNIMQKFAILEFKKGDAERGRTLFEGLVASSPKRLDLWLVLIDQESSQADPQQTVRRLFERVLATKLSMKKAKSVFKKWLGFEKEKGSEDDVENVKARAIEYVEQH